MFAYLCVHLCGGGVGQGGNNINIIVCICDAVLNSKCLAVCDWLLKANERCLRRIMWDIYICILICETRSRRESRSMRVGREGIFQKMRCMLCTLA